jgi:hypothetical protein
LLFHPSVHPHCSSAPLICLVIFHLPPLFSPLVFGPGLSLNLPLQKKIKYSDQCVNGTLLPDFNIRCLHNSLCFSTVHIHFFRVNFLNNTNCLVLWWMKYENF